MRIILIFLFIGCLNKNLNTLKQNLDKDDINKEYTLKEILNKLLNEYLEAKKNQNIQLKEDKEKKLKFLFENYTPLELGKYFLAEVQIIIGNKASNLNNKIFIIENVTNLKIDFKYNSWFEAVDFNKENIEALVELGIDINEINCSGENLLHRACYESNLSLVKYLMKKNIDINKKENRLGFTPLFFAIRSGSLEIVKYLLERVSNIEEIDLEHRTIFHHAMIALENCFIHKNENLISQYCNMVSYLMKILFNQSTFNKKIAKSYTINYKKIIHLKDIYHKCFYDYLNYFSNLLRIKISSFEEFTIYHANKFFEKEHLKLILIEKKIIDDSSRFLDFGGIKIDLFKLIETDNAVFLEYMLEKASPKETKHVIFHIFNVIFHPAENPKIPTKLLKFFLDNHFNLLKQTQLLLADFNKPRPLFCEDEVDSCLNNLLSISIKKDDYDLFEILLSKIVNINSFTNYRQFSSKVDIESTHLNEIIKLGRNEMFDLILKRDDLKIASQDKLGYTAAHYAVEYSRLNMLEKLLNNGASLEIQNYGNETPTDIALKIDNKEILKFLKLESNLKENKKTYYQKSTKEKDLYNKRIEENEKLNKSISMEREENFRKNYEENYPLHHCLISNNIEKFRNLLTSDNSNLYDPKNNITLLELAVFLRKIEFIKLLLEKGANPLGVRVEKTITIYGSQTETRHPVCMQIAIDIEDQNTLEILSILLKCIKDHDKLNFLIHSLENKKFNSFTKIFETLNESNKYDYISKILILSIEKTLKKDEIEFLLENFNPLLNLNKNGEIFLRKVINHVDKDYSIEIINLLIQYGMDVNLNDSNNIPLVFTIVSKNYIPLIDSLLENKRDINFNLIFKKNNLKYLENLTQLTFQYLLRNININKLFLKLCSNNYLNLLNCLIGLKEIKNFENILIYAFEKENVKAVKALFLKRLVKINERMNENGETPLTLAVKFNNLKLIKFLLKQEELNVNIKNKEGKTALLVSILDSPKCLERDLIIRKLLNNGADVNAKYVAGCNTLMLAIMKGNISTVKEILNKDVKINDQNLFGETALILVIKDLNVNSEDKLKIIERLLEKEDIDLDIKDKKGNDIFKLTKELETSKFKNELINLLKLRKRDKF